MNLPYNKVTYCIVIVVVWIIFNPENHIVHISTRKFVLTHIHSMYTDKYSFISIYWVNLLQFSLHGQWRTKVRVENSVPFSVNASDSSKLNIMAIKNIPTQLDKGK